MCGIADAVHDQQERRALLDIVDAPTGQLVDLLGAQLGLGEEGLSHALNACTVPSQTAATRNGQMPHRDRTRSRSVGAEESSGAGAGGNHTLAAPFLMLNLGLDRYSGRDGD